MASALLPACQKKAAPDQALPPQQTIQHEVLILMPPPNGMTVIRNDTPPSFKEARTLL